MTVLRDVTLAAVAMLVSTACFASQADRASTCGPGMACRLAGTLDIESKWQVSLDQGNRCIALALPESFHETYRQFDDRKVTVLGSAFSQPHASEGSVLIGYLVDGMRVSPNLCEFAISVDEIAAGDEVVWRRSDDDEQSTGTAALHERKVAESARVFASPGDLVGQQVTVCGYMHDRFEDTNIWPDEDASGSDERGLRLLSFDGEAGRRQRDGRLGCVTGTIEWAGCGTTNYCTSSGFDYGIRLLPDGDSSVPGSGVTP